MTKTNAIRLLEAAGIHHTKHDYSVDEDDLSGITVANKIGVEPDSVFKTLVAAGDKTGINVFCIPVTAELDLKKSATVSGNKKIEMLKMKSLLPVTGYIRGGCSPIGMKKKFPVYIDETSQVFEKIFISAGTRGTQICISPNNLLTITGARFADLI